MEKAFPCPKCGHPLTPPGHAISMQCPACKNFVIIPESAPRGEPAVQPDQEQAIRARIDAGDDAGAIRLYQEAVVNELIGRLRGGDALGAFEKTGESSLSSSRTTLKPVEEDGTEPRMANHAVEAARARARRRFATAITLTVSLFLLLFAGLVLLIILKPS